MNVVLELHDYVSGAAQGSDEEAGPEESDPLSHNRWTPKKSLNFSEPQISHLENGVSGGD